MNKKRQAIWDKSGGKCWYCGCTLPEKGWHADHFEPIQRNWRDGTCQHPERDTEENKVPACASCNINKHSMSLESWRKIIQGYVNSLNRDSTQYKLAKRYGLIEEKPIEVKFWFEENGY
ncbi:MULTISPECIES: HNH endonuclease signature motif containing protein [unclassified Oceanobacillus]|uniref:HNH endonuclease n=1 Tax=unclassified Oceanobacillus TaxID=2630292 RepID=UPI001BE61100|nr:MULTISPECIES: HNH endonuclease signature motif containing protein [unclassified Oceanobacillus]MBT2601400.1 HNH endonuclease [Oceanobacillus sp. ISL-74]MBT2653324.1 HNH endonuclease [Oceanobacillus sp. ISL-73]